LRRSNFLKWLYPGMHVKRWLLLVMVGVAVMGLGFAYFLREAYSSYTFPTTVYYVTLQFIPRWIRGLLFVFGATLTIAFGIWKLNTSLLSAFLDPARNESLVELIYNHRFLRRGPKIVAIGGGTGLSMLLRGLKEYTGNLTAVVTVADDGGSTGRLRQELGIIAPGDIRKCITALADAEPLMTRLFEYRFEEGEGLEGHSFGNLFIVAMSEVTGNFEEAIRQTSRVLAVRGQILPSTFSDVTLVAETEDEEVILGEHNITERGGSIRRLFLQPENPQANPEAIRAILNADMIVVGPGSLFTSVLPNLLVPGIRQAFEISPALKVYVCNVATERGETDSFGVADHYEALCRHIGHGHINFLLANSNVSSSLPPQWHSQPVVLDRPIVNGVRVLPSDVVAEENRYRHDPKKVADALMRLYYERQSLDEVAGRVAAESEVPAVNRS
jgi:uncharacterized cofD-like protein